MYLRCHVVTADTTYKGHAFQFDDSGTAQILDRYTDQPVRTMWHATVESRDGAVHRVVGQDAEGREVIWRAVRACAKCSQPAVYATPAFDVPT
jgi:hypothetical protein